MYRIFSCIILIIGVPTTKVGTLVDNAPAQAVGIKVGDEIKEVNGQEVTSSTEITNIISASKGKEINLVVNRDGKDVEFDLSPKFSKDTQTYIIGITFDRTKNIIKSFTTSITTTWDIAVQMVEFLGQLVTGRVAGGLSNSVAGPVGVIGMVSDAAKTGITNVLYLGAVNKFKLRNYELSSIPSTRWGKITTIINRSTKRWKKIRPKQRSYDKYSRNDCFNGIYAIYNI